MRKLNTPLKRIGFIVFLVGALTLTVGLYSIFEESYRFSSGIEKWVGSVFFNRYDFKEYKAASYGTWLVIFGALLSFLYDSVTSRLVRWIKGSPNIESEENEKEVQLHFKDAESAIEYMCKYMDFKIIENEFIPCLVVATSQSKESGAFAVIKIPSVDGPQKAIAAFVGADAPSNIAGRLCTAMIGPTDPDTGVTHFLLCAELEPTWSPAGWKVKRRF